jgi:Mn-dependent DtxR family transcriptional regulator
MTSYWAEALGCQAEDYYEQLKTLLEARGELGAGEAARFLGCDLETIQLLLSRLVEEGLAQIQGEAGVLITAKP